MSLGYVALVALFLAMVGFCFAFAFLELRRPRDPGPLQIDVRRDMRDRHFASRLRRMPAAAVAGATGRSRARTPHLIYGAEEGPESYLMLVDGETEPGGTLDAFLSDGIATLAAGSTVRAHADGARGLVVGPGARVGGRATSEGWIVLEPGAEVSFAGAPFIVTLSPGRDEHGERDTGEPDAPRDWDDANDLDLEWILTQGMPLDQAMRVLSHDGRQTNGVQAVARLERSDAPVAAASAWRPSWLADTPGFFLGAQTVRVEGDLTLPAGAVVPFHLIVDGVLVAGDGTSFHGGVSVRGPAALGRGCRVDGSLAATGTVHLGRGSVVGDCVSAGEHLVVAPGCSVGGDRHGGIASGGRVWLDAGVVIRNKLFAEEGTVVGDGAAYEPLPDTNIGQSSPTGTHAP